MICLRRCGGFLFSASLMVATVACEKPSPARKPEPISAADAAYLAMNAEAAVVAKIRFECFWWSDVQMEGLDPNNPPPKLTSVTIDKWEYSDPIGVPHPDTIDAIVDVSSISAATIPAFKLLAREQWLVGSRGDSEGARWEDWKTVESSSAVDASSTVAGQLRFPIDVAKKMASLAERDQWPSTYRIEVRVIKASPTNDSAVASEMTSVVAELPFSGGD